MAQLDYGYSTPKGIAGGLFDISTYEINTRRVESESGEVKFGMGLVQGEKAGITVKVPTATTDKFEGVAVNGLTTEADMEGNVVVKKNVSVGLMAVGKIWVRLAEGVDPEYGDKAYVVVTGADAGCFTNVSGGIETKAVYVEKDVDNGIAAIAISR